MAAVPLALGYPAPAVAPSARSGCLLGAVGATQFLGQLLLNRGFQLESATRGSAINVLQVGGGMGGAGAALFTVCYKAGER